MARVLGPATSNSSNADSLWGKIVGFGGSAGNLVAGGASDLGTHLGQLGAIGTGKLVTAVTGDNSLENKVNQRLQEPQTNLFGAPVAPIQGGTAGLEQLGGDALRTGAEIGAFAAAPASIPAAIGTGAALGAAEGAGSAMQNGGSLSDVAVQGGVGGVVGGAGAGVLGAAGKVISGLGKAAYKAVIPTSEREAGLMQAYKASMPFAKRVQAALTGAETKVPTTAADTAFSQGLKGTESMLGVQANRAASNIWSDVISPALKGAKEAVNMPAFFEDAATSITKNTKELGDRAARLEALKSIADEYASKPTALLEELQGFKEGWASHVPNKYYNGKDITATYNAVRAELADQARQKIYGALGKDVKQAYFDYGNLKAVMELGKKAMTGGKMKGGFGSFWTAIKDMALTPVATVGGRTVYRVGQGIELTGKNGATILSDIINPTILESLQSSQNSTQSLRQPQ